MNLLKFGQTDSKKRAVLATGYVVPDPARCVQCGICTYNCPVGIDVRLQVWQKKPIYHSQCMACGECVARCPRGVLRFEEIEVFSKGEA